MRSATARTCAIVLFILMAACTTHVPLASDYRGPDLLPAAAVAEVVLQSEPLAIGDDTALRDRAGFVVRPLSVKSAVDPTQSIEFEYYDVDGDERRPVIVLLPVFKGVPAIPRFFARYFANQGWAAIVVLRGHDPLEALVEPEASVQRSLADYRRVLDWVEGEPELDAKRVGVFGVSLGAIDAVVLAALDRRVDALVVAMAGGDVPYLAQSTNYRRVVREIQDLADREGISREAWTARLEDEIKTDPLRLARYIDAHRVLMIVTRTDAIVPFEAQQKLRASLGSPETIYLRTGHRSSVLLFPKLRSTAFGFFTRQFGIEPDGPTRPRA
jgi:dienelactone hydrolase